MPSRPGKSSGYDYEKTVNYSFCRSFSPAVAPLISWLSACKPIRWNTSGDEKPLTVKLNNPRQEVSFVYDNQLLHLKQGISASGARYTDGIYVFWSKGDEATVYKRDRIVLNNCQLQNPQR
ncbi:putative lipoprotein [Escherichia coli]|uniref:Putative lipoprotein n=3 Tax=Enterobacteriaceae TaxID=543 RepID=A0A2X1KCS4_ECOLX|nr:putative lipoprotein [Escherichia coli]